jgi:hypothetical protein
VKPALAVAALALLASSCGGKAKQSAQPETTAPVQAQKVVTPPSHVKALAWVKQCQAALATLRIAPVAANEAPAVKRLVEKAIVACGKSDDLNTLVNLNRADSFVDGAYLGEIVTFYGLGNFHKYVSEIAAGKKGHANILGLAQEQIKAGKERLRVAVIQLPYPP